MLCANLLLSAVIIKIKVWVCCCCFFLWMDLVKNNSKSVHCRQRICIHRIVEYPKLEGTHKGHGVQPLAPHNTIQNSNHIYICEHCPNTPWALAGRGSDHRPRQPVPRPLPPGEEHFPSPPTWPSPDTASFHSLGSCCCRQKAEINTAPLFLVSSCRPLWGIPWVSSVVSLNSFLPFLVLQL